MGAVVGEDGVDLVGHGGDKAREEVCGDAPAFAFSMQLDEGELRGAVDGDEEVELALRGLTSAMSIWKIADRIGLELALGGLVAFDLGQPADAVALQAAMQRRARQMRDGRLQGVEAIVERQQGMPSESDDDGLFLDRQDRRSGLLRPGRQIGDRRPLLPLGDRLLD